MNELEFQEEWLSAYLDDELTDEQRRVVEQRLAIDPAAQATLEDLQRVRSMVSKLPTWSGPGLKFAIPAGKPGSFDEADDELDVDPENESNDLDDFEEVPRVVAGADEPRVSFSVKPESEFSSRSLSSWIGWGATAACILIAAGVGSLFFWPPAGSQVAYAPAETTIAAKSPPRLSELERDNAEIDSFAENNSVDNSVDNGVLEGRDLAPSGVDTMERVRAFGAPVAAENQSGTGLAKRSPPASRAKESVQLQADAIDPQVDVPPLSNFADSKMKSELDPATSSPLPAAPGAAFGGAGGFGGGLADANLAMNSPVSDPQVAAPKAADSRVADSRVADLPAAGSLATELPAPMRSSGIESAETTNTPSAQNTLGSAFYYARSQSWSDDETQSRLSSGAQQYRADQLAFGNNAYQRGVEQDRVEVATESVLMAAIKPEVANSPEFFQKIIASNQLVEVDQRPVLNQYSIANTAQMTNAAQVANTAPNNNLPSNNSVASSPAATGSFEAVQNNTPSSESANALGLNRFSNQRYQMAMPNQTHGNSIVLFLTRDEANQILNQLREKGQVTSQIWTVDKQLETQPAAGNQSYNTNQPLSQNAANQRLANEPASQANQANQRTETATNGKVILLLNGPPN